MADFSCAYPDSGAISDLDQLCDEEDLASTISTLSGGEEPNGETRDSFEQDVVASKLQVRHERTVPIVISPPRNSDDTENKALGAHPTSCCTSPDEEPKTMSKQPLNLLDLPVDLLQEIIKEVTHTNDLTALALTCSALHSLAIPQMYSRFDIVWPDAFPQSDHPAGVDALSYGLATLVMGEDIFREVPPHYSRSPCAHCRCNGAESGVQITSDSKRRARRGNYFAQYTRKFSVGNGPPDWVQEYSVTKETGKMLGTLVALAVARMINLETFVWDMPTGVVRDVWIALASLADRPGHECRLENVWIRWHDNSDNTNRPPPGATTSSSLTLPETQNMLLSPTIGLSLFRRYRHVEYPSLSILPPLKNLSVLDIDEPSYLEEMAVLIKRSRDRLKELRIGISSKVYQIDWLKPQSSSQPAPSEVSTSTSGWPKAGGVLGAVLGWPSHHAREPPSTHQESAQGEDGEEPVETTPQVETLTPSSIIDPSSPQMHNVVDAQNLPEAESLPCSDPHEPQLPDSKGPREASKRSPRSSYTATSESGRQLLKLEVLELERVSISAPALTDTIDWTRVTTLTILRCEGHEKLWRALRRRFAPTGPRSGARQGKKEGLGQDKSSEYPLRIKHIHTDAVSPYLLLFVKDTLRPDTLETVFLHGAPLHDSAVHVEAIYRNIIRSHRSSLRKLLVDSTERAPGGAEIGSTRWRKWMFTREMITFMTSGRMPKLNELSMTLDSKDWHYFLQRLPYIPHLRALHIPHLVRPIHLDLKELALQVLDIVTLRPEINLSYFGIQSKCYEILEGKGKEYDLTEADDVHSEGLVPGAENWAGSDTNDEDSDEDDDGSTMDLHSDVSSDDHRSLDDDDGSDYDYGRPRVSFRLREILFYDDKIAIFKARHGVL
ncbi:uncharacterized protein BJX67DRAFT_344519 [Aspergillus lucknowensis]|uniref:F-box domain-containing protein n=1 Tax=Aspergillus lucknowensis TaxID=176173 RepID=A0ABR4M1S6_9EURO